jgi:type IV pilus assembly protein PilA
MKRTLVVLALVAGCHKDRSTSQAPLPSPTAPASTSEQDALWAKAPEGAVGGLVMSSRAITLFEHGWHDVHAFLKSFPAFAPAEQEMTAELAKVGLSPDFTAADLGLAPGKGFALFVVGDEPVMLLPVGDRDKFLAKVKGTKGTDVDRIDEVSCKMLDGGWYGCAKVVALFDKLGKGNLKSKLDAAKARGDIEGVATGEVEVAAVMQLDRGAFVARGVVGGVPKMITSKLGTPVKPRVDIDHAAGFAVLNVQPLLAEVPPLPIVEGVTAADLAKTVNGPLSITMAPGDFNIDSRIPLSDTGPAQKLIDHCGDLPPMLGAKTVGGSCHIPVPQYNFGIDFWIDGKELHMGTKGAKPSGSSVPPSAIGAEIAKGEWQAALWGHGTLLAPDHIIPADLPDTMPDQAAMVIRAIVMFNEVGLAVTLDGDAVRFVVSGRSAWSNPDDVVAKLQAVSPDDILKGKGGEVGKAIADSAPKSPFAADYQAGASGLMAPTAVIGMLAAVAVPAFLDYMKKSKQSEASLQLNKIGKSIKRYWIENNKLPVGDAKTLPDFPTCCGLSSTGQGVDGKCPNDPAAWGKDKIWSALEISIDEPTMYRYSYHSDGKTVKVTATGDADCDGQFATYELNVEIDSNNNAKTTLVKPPHGVY